MSNECICADEDGVIKSKSINIALPDGSGGALGVSIERQEDGTMAVIADYYFDDNHQYSTAVKANYCPICGGRVNAKPIVRKRKMAEK